YDAAGRLTGITHKDGSGTALATYAYAYDAASRMTAKTENGATTSYAYDATSQLTADGATTFGYDANGNRTNAGYATGSGNRTSKAGRWTYWYDAEGNVVKKSKGAAADTGTYAYDNHNQMVGAADTRLHPGRRTLNYTKSRKVQEVGSHMI